MQQLLAHICVSSLVLVCFGFPLMFLEENHTDSLRGPLGNAQGQTSICGSDRSEVILQHLQCQQCPQRSPCSGVRTHLIIRLLQGHGDRHTNRLGPLTWLFSHPLSSNNYISSSECFCIFPCVALALP